MGDQDPFFFNKSVTIKLFLMTMCYTHRSMFCSTTSRDLQRVNPNVEADRRKSGVVKRGKNLKLDTLCEKKIFQLKNKK